MQHTWPVSMSLKGGQLQIIDRFYSEMVKVSIFKINFVNSTRNSKSFGETFVQNSLTSKSVES